MFTSFYSVNSFTNPISKANITVRKHITQSEERPESNFEVMLRHYRNDKMHDIEEMKKANMYVAKQSNVRTLNKILGKEPPKPKEFAIKRRERKWTLGGSLAQDGNIYNSPGLQKLMDLKETVDKLPTNLNFEKKILQNMFVRRQSRDVLTQYNEIADKLLPEYRDLLL